MNYKLERENGEKAADAAKNLIEILRPAILNLDEMLQESKELYVEAINRWGDAHGNKDEVEKAKADKSCDIWRLAEEEYKYKIEAMEDAIRFAKRLL